MTYSTLSSVTWYGEQETRLMLRATNQPSKTGLKIVRNCASSYTVYIVTKMMQYVP